MGEEFIGKRNSLTVTADDLLTNVETLEITFDDPAFLPIATPLERDRFARYRRHMVFGLSPPRASADAE
jgi:hypothetical protein